MAKLIFITGGCRSGKSTLALDLAKKRGGKTAFVATAVGFDAEMRQRIREHRLQRPRGWESFEAPYALSARLASLPAFDTVVIDCVTVYLANLMVKKRGAAAIEKEIGLVLERIRTAPGVFIVVSNEVGSGVVPAVRMGRKFRDLAGGVNKSLAAAADRVYLTVAGIPVKIK